MKMIRISLPYPPGYNASYRASAIYDPRKQKWTARYYKTKAAKAWQDEATVLIQAALMTAGITPQRDRPFCWFAIYKLKSQRLDADAPEKLLMDAIRDALGIDDSRLAAYLGSKQFCPRKEQSFQVWIAGRAASGDDEFNVLAEHMADEALATLYELTR